MVLITYKPGPAAAAAVYEPWLRREDNPTFNAVDGIGEYSNWKVLAPGTLQWTHFDFLGLATPGDLERVWFSPDLDRFRKQWVERWGYGGAGAGPLSAYATLCMREGDPIRARKRFVEIELDARPHASAERWQVVESLRKHWAVGPAPSGEPWRKPAAEFNPLGCFALSMAFHAHPPARADWSARRILAECIAAP